MGHVVDRPFGGFVDTPLVPLRSDCEDNLLKEIQMETIGATYKQLVTVFGKPEGLTWTVQFANGTRAVIASMSKEPKTRIREWYVMGDSGA